MTGKQSGEFADISSMEVQVTQFEFWIIVFGTAATIVSVVFGTASLLKWPVEMIRALIFVFRSGQKPNRRILALAVLFSVAMFVPAISAVPRPIGAIGWLIFANFLLLWQIVVHQLWRRVQGKPIGDLAVMPERSRNLLPGPEFYSSQDWLELRYRVLRKYGNSCMLCKCDQVQCTSIISSLDRNTLISNLSSRTFRYFAVSVTSASRISTKTISGALDVSPLLSQLWLSDIKRNLR